MAGFSLLLAKFIAFRVAIFFRGCSFSRFREVGRHGYFMIHGLHVTSLYSRKSHQSFHTQQQQQQQHLLFKHGVF